MAGKVILVTGAAGFIGSSLVVTLSDNFQVIGIDKRKPPAALVNAAEKVEWIELNIGDAAVVNSAFQQAIKDYGKIDFIIHLAAYYHFGIDWQEEYEITNITGTQNICNAAAKFGVQRIIFSSSIAALDPSENRQILNEESHPSDYIPYAKSKSEGERIINNVSAIVPGTILRFGGVFSDWCELPPLYSLIRLWSSFKPISNMIPGKGESGFPYIHRKDVIRIILRCITFHKKLSDFEVLIASQNGAILHKDLYPVIKAALNYRGSDNPIYISKSLAEFALMLKLKSRLFLKATNFEQPWMLKYTDLPWIVNNDYTQNKLDWNTSPHLDIQERLPLIIKHYKEQKKYWISRNEQRISGNYIYKNNGI